MYLLFEPLKKGLRYGLFTTKGEPMYSDFYPVVDWSPRSVDKLFNQQLLPKLRNQGKLFTKIGLIIPFATPDHIEPIVADPKILKQLAQSQLRQKTLESVTTLLALSQKSWPHLSHYFLFDTHLSADLKRDIVIPPFDYATSKTMSLHPYLLYSYGHKANLMNLKQDKDVISLYIGEQVSLALFRDNTLVDAIVSYSPLSPFMGLYGSGALDPGFYLELAQKRRPAEIMQIVTEKSGLLPMTETQYDFANLLQIAGLVPRDKSVNFDELSIEAIEWIELSVRSYVRSIRHGLGALLTNDNSIKTLVVNTSLIPESSGLWNIITKGSLEFLKIVPSPIFLLQGAAEDLARFES